MLFNSLLPSCFVFQTPGFYVKDKIKKFIVNQIIMIPIVASIVEIIAVGGDYLFLYLWLFTFVVSVVSFSVVYMFFFHLLICLFYAKHFIIAGPDHGLCRLHRSSFR